MLFRRKAPPPTPLRAPWSSIRDAPGFCSSGIPALDQSLGGGYPVGGVVSVAAGPGTANEQFLLVALPAIANFLSHGRGVTIVPPVGIPASRIRDRLAVAVPDEMFQARVRILDYTTIELDRKWVVPMGRFGRGEAARAMVRAEQDARGASEGPYLEISALDTLDAATNPGERVAALMLDLARIRQRRDLAIVWTTPESKTTPVVRRMADVELALRSEDGSVLIEGLRPSWIARSIGWTDPREGPRVDLGLR